MEGSTRRLLLVAAINLAGFVAEVLGGIVFGSLALVSDGLHNLLDGLAYVMAFVTTWLATERAGSEAWTYGFHRLEVLSAFLNGSMLFPMALFIIYESYQRFLEPVDVGVVPVIAIASAGLAVNLVSMRIVEGGRGLNEKGAYLHLFGDAGGSVAVIVGTVAMHVTGLALFDPLVAVLIALVVLYSAGRVVRKSLGIFLQKSPIPASEIQEAIESVEGVEEAHDVRIWEVCSQLCVATVHAVVSVQRLAEARRIREAIEEVLRDRFVIHHVTVQIEEEPSEQETEHGMDEHDH